MTRSFIIRRPRLSVGLTILGCMLGVSVIARLDLMHQSLRLDEAQSLWQTSHSIGDTLRVVAQDVHVPLYHVILHFWQLYFGNGVMTARLLSLLFFLATIPLVYLLASQVLARGWALFTVVVFSFLPFMDWYASEARMYTLLALMATLSQLFFIRLIQRKPSAWRGYGLTAVIGAYSHYFFSFNLAAQAIFYLFNRQKFGPKSFRRFVAVSVLVVLALLPWLIYFHSLGSAKNTAPALLRPSTVDFFNAFSQFMFGFQNDYINTIVVSCWPLVVLVAFFAIQRGQRLSPELSYLATAGFVPILLAYGLSFVVSPFFLSRYMISCVAPLVILLVWLISHYGRTLARTVAVAMLVVILLSSLRQDWSASTPVKEDYQAVARQVAAQAQPQDLIVMSAPFTVYPFEYYYNGSAQIMTLPMWNRQAVGAIPAFSKAKLPAEVNQLNQHHHDVYLILSQDQGYEETIRQYYLRHFKQLSHHTFTPDLSLYVFQVGYNQVPALGSPVTLISSDNVQP